MNCKRNTVFNKLLRGSMCLFKSELWKQWKQKRNGEQGQDCPLKFLDWLGKSPVWHLNMLQEAFLMLCLCLQPPLGLLPYVTDLPMVAMKMLHESGKLNSFCQSQLWSRQLPVAANCFTRALGWALGCNHAVNLGEGRCVGRKKQEQKEMTPQEPTAGWKNGDTQETCPYKKCRTENC